jgi:hypothetical protein
MLILCSLSGFAQSSDFFFYIPSEEEIQAYVSMRTYLKAWNDNKIEVDDARLTALLTNQIGKETLQSLLFESFLRYTKNKKIQTRVLQYMAKNKIDTPFVNSLKKLYAARQVKRKVDGQDVIQYNYRNQEYDENINLFWFDEAGVFNDELGLLLFDNAWTAITFNEPNTTGDNSLVLMYGGGTNAMTISFNKFSNLSERDFETKCLKGTYIELPLEGILSRAGATRIVVSQGEGPDIIETIDAGTFSIYLYNKTKRVLYQVSYYMNFSPVNIHYQERRRIYNFLLFQLLFVFLE